MVHKSSKEQERHQRMASRNEEMERKLHKYRELIENGQLEVRRELRSLLQHLCGDDCLKNFLHIIRQLVQEGEALKERVDTERELFPWNLFEETINTLASTAELPRYGILISSIPGIDSTIGQIKSALSTHFTVLVRVSSSSSSDMKIYLDNTDTAVIALLSQTYEQNEICQADLIHIFKRQFPLVFVLSEENFAPTTSCLKIVYYAPTTQKVFLRQPNFSEKLHKALNDAQWKLTADSRTSETVPFDDTDRRRRFLGGAYEWIVPFSQPAEVSRNYREMINDPLRIPTETKLQEIYYHYVQNYFHDDSEIRNLFKESVNSNDVCRLVCLYTTSGKFCSTLNRHLAANLLAFFGSTLDETVDYRLVKSLIDFVALFIYRQELRRLAFKGTVYRGVLMSESDLCKYVVGSRLLNTSFLSTSTDQKVAEFFSGKDEEKVPVLCTYKIKNFEDRRTALDISSLSQFVHEREVLILPFSAFRVTSVQRATDRSEPIKMTLEEDQCGIVESI